MGDAKVVSLRGEQNSSSGGPGGPERPSSFLDKRRVTWLVTALAVLTMALLFFAFVAVWTRLKAYDESHVLVGVESFRALSYQASLSESLSKNNIVFYEALKQALDEKKSLELRIQALQKGPGFGEGYVEGRREALDHVALRLGLGSEFFDQLLWTAEICHGDSNLVWMRDQLAGIAAGFGCSCYCSELVNLTIKDASLEQVLAFLARESGVPVFNDAKITGNVTLRFTDIPASLALQAIVGQFGADLRFEDGAYHVVPFVVGGK
ncbi:MAG: hypothetical protein HYY51_02650 [Candidatus Magasanikbacteria bacterium]|nr:hypothetical protein [Candidatus Magasanikbacteria bacterium]